MPRLDKKVQFNAPKPWRDSGVEIDKDAGLVTVQEALKAGELDWDVHLEDLYRCNRQGEYEALQFGKAIIRDDNDAWMANVGNEYRPLQNNDAFGILDDIVGGREAMVTTVGSFGGGQYSWMMLQLPDYIEIPNTDVRFEERLFATNAHTGKRAFTIGFTAVNIVCWNTYLQAVHGLKHKVAIRHTTSATVNLKQVRNALGLASQYFDTLGTDLKDLARVQMYKTDVDAVVAELIPEKLVDGVLTLSDYNKRQRTRLTELFDEGIGNDIDGIRGTALAALNAVTQYIDHERGSVSQDSRFRSAILGTGEKFKANALGTIQQYVAGK